MQPVDAIEVRDLVVRIGVAALIGAALGVNRELRDKPAGVKTHALVALGAALLTVIGVDLASSDSGTDSNAISRIVQGVVTGIGFLGGGVILRQEASRSVTGLTTAATIWIAAALGVACGAGRWTAALLASGLTLLILIVGDPLEQMLRQRFGTHGKPESPLED